MSVFRSCEEKQAEMLTPVDIKEFVFSLCSQPSDSDSQSVCKLNEPLVRNVFIGRGDRKLEPCRGTPAYMYMCKTILFFGETTHQSACIALVTEMVLLR